ncbi:MAG: hypothetical protein CMJ25_17915 [Phycisphaerae bacterium]|nr:hypothetical protein [Phycisphaerae bacterium]|tara:strand:+ start:1552 stop:1776 length:225 start_codon:yes stop_codon:yes gene_type:complete
MAKTEKEKKENKPIVVLDDKEYEIESMEEDQKVMLAHIQDLQRKIDGATFNLQQLQYGRQAFVNALKEALEKEE